MSKTMTWNYKGEADITLGEVHASPLPKILTALIVLAVIVVGILAFIQREFIYDNLNNPHIVLTQESVTIPYQGKFNALDYIDQTKTLKYDKFMEYGSTMTFAPVEDSELPPYYFVYDSNVDTSIPGDYKVTYYSHNHIQDNEVSLTVTVTAPVDETAPTITLKTNEVTLYYNHEDIKDFDPEDYIQSLSDDKSSDVYLRDNLTYEISESSNSIQLQDVQNLYIDLSDLDSDVTKYSREEMEEFIGTYTDLVNNTSTKSYSIEFTTKDESDNSSSAILNVVVVLDVDIIEEKLQARIDEWNEKQDEPIVTKPSGGNGNNGGGNSGTTTKPSNGGGTITCTICGEEVNEADWPNHRMSHSRQQ